MESSSTERDGERSVFLMSVTVIIPAARGLEKNQIPCWLKQHPKGHSILLELLHHLTLENVKAVFLAVLKEHIFEFCNGDVSKFEAYAAKAVSNDNIEFKVISIDGTSSAPETVSAIIKDQRISGPIFIKDVDSCFSHRVLVGNYVVGLRLRDVPNLIDIPQRSFIEATGTFLGNIHEKRVTSDVICAGGYAFEDAKLFLSSVEELKHRRDDGYRLLFGSCPGKNERMFVSHVIRHQMFHDRVPFGVVFTQFFCDWKSDLSWNQFLSEWRSVHVVLESAIMTMNNESDLTAKYVRRLDTWNINTEVVEQLRQFNRETTRIILFTQCSRENSDDVYGFLQKHKIPYDDVVFSFQGSLHPSKSFIVY
ncbi:uncharacterized protein TM35_000221790 [Trypanosoma theileri]|uniref:Uncharacterized protein n=1 Tax=Trypanosoma theileri TaxID=67003 RepID=A0A1X0NTE0_9TRYP|nr:uncharacterized protein TM35_000221790 [Trypanosoma theileri]ORC87380.1 hypothetical protein TM35_000221790 [Trypanosoma theileri]